MDENVRKEIVRKYNYYDDTANHAAYELKTKKTVAVWGCYESICRNNNLFFSMNSSDDGGINPTPENELFKYLRKNNIELRSLDTLENPGQADLYIFYDYPNIDDPIVRAAFGSDNPKFLVVLESKIIRSLNWHPVYIQHFEKIFTYCDDLINNQKYIKQNVAFFLPQIKEYNTIERTKFCKLIICNRQTNKH